MAELSSKMLFKSGRREPEQVKDEDLVKAFRDSGDLELLGELYSRYMHLVYGVCLKYLKNRDESQDAVMQIFEKLIKEIPRHSIENFGSWLHVVAKNYCLMQLRSDKAKNENLTDWLNDPVIFMENEPVLHPMDDEETIRENKLAECLEKLKDEQKECINQFYYQDRCYAEIAENLNIDEKKVKSALQNAKRNLKICMEDNGREK